MAKCSDHDMRMQPGIAQGQHHLQHVLGYDFRLAKPLELLKLQAWQSKPAEDDQKQQSVRVAHPVHDHDALSLLDAESSSIEFTVLVADHRSCSLVVLRKLGVALAQTPHF